MHIVDFGWLVRIAMDVAWLAQNTVPSSTPNSSAPAAPGGGNLITMLLPMLVIFGVFWFFVIRPEVNERKQKDEMLKALKNGDRVVTSGGLIGTVAKLTDNEITLKIDEKGESKVRFLRSAVLAKLKDEDEKNAAKP